MEPLKRYFKILNGTAKPKFQLAKKRGTLEKQIDEIEKILKHCELCERRCGVNRMAGELGWCGVGLQPRIFGAHMHWGEEHELVPSATLFFAGCTMRCVYCQNAPQSVNYDMGELWSADDIARWIEQAAAHGARNINFVGGEPTPNLLVIVRALEKVSVNIPIVWNSNAYYSERTAEILKDLIDIYLLDFRYFNDRCAQVLSSSPNYVKTAKRNHLLAEKHSELMIRLLVLPGHLECDAKPILQWIKDNLRKYKLNILDQYWPAWHAASWPELAAPLSTEEKREIFSYAQALGLKYSD